MTLTNTGTGLVLHATTGNSGFYDVPSVPLGTYSVTFSKTGFKQETLTGVVVKVGAIAVDGSLQVGSTTEHVTVTAQPQLVQTEESEKSSDISTVMVQELPNVGGSWYNVITLPGAADTGQDASFNGVAGDESNFLQDGGFSTYPVDQNPDSVNNLTLDSISEVHISTSNFAAEYGSGAAVFDVITKGGTNQWHGSLFERLQNTAFLAKNYFNQGPRGTLNWNEYGGTLGGPILHDKLFFFYSYQNNPTNSPSQGFQTYPTDAMRNGDFSIFCHSGFTNGVCNDRDPNGNVIDQIYDPSTYNSTTNSRQPFAGNIIPSARIDAVAANIESYFPHAQNQNSLSNNYYQNLVTPDTTWWQTARLDYNISPKQRAFAKLTYLKGTEVIPDPACPANCGPVYAHEMQFQATDTWTFTPHLLGEFHFSTIDFFGGITNPTVGSGITGKLGMQNAPFDQFPNIGISGGFGTGIGGGTTAQQGEAGDVPSAGITWVKGKHEFKFGGEFDKYHDAFNNWGATTSGNFSFNGDFTNNPSNPSGATGLGYADFLLGLPQSWNANEYPIVLAHEWNVQSFAEDSYKIKPTLTLQYGLRFTRMSGWYADKNEIYSFDPTITNPATTNPITGLAQAAMPGAMWFGLNSTNGRTALQNTQNGWAPRVGFAWSPRQNWAIRGAYGVFDTPRGFDNFSSGGTYALNPTGNEVSNGIVPIFTLSSPLPSLTTPSVATLTPDFLNAIT